MKNPLKSKLVSTIGSLAFIAAVAVLAFAADVSYNGGDTIYRAQGGKSMVFPAGTTLTVEGTLDAQLASITLAAASVDTAKLATDAVTTAKVLNGAIDSNKLASGSVIAAKIGTSAVETAKLGSDSVTTAKLLNSAVDTAKLGADSVTGAKILNGTIGTSKLNTTHAGGALCELGSGAFGHCSAADASVCSCL